MTSTVRGTSGATERFDALGVDPGSAGTVYAWDGRRRVRVHVPRAREPDAAEHRRHGAGGAVPLLRRGDVERRQRGERRVGARRHAGLRREPAPVGAADVGRALRAGSPRSRRPDRRARSRRRRVADRGACAASGDAGPDADAHAWAVAGGDAGRSAAGPGRDPAPRPPAAAGRAGHRGRPVVGRTLTCSPGRWSGAPALSFAWTRDAAGIRGATAARYRVAARDVRHRIGCLVTATNAGGRAQASARAVGPARRR